MPVEYFHIQTPQTSLTFAGSIKPDGDYVWLCTPAGDPVLRVEKKYVTKTTLAELSGRVASGEKVYQASNPNDPERN